MEKERKDQLLCMLLAYLAGQKVSMRDLIAVCKGYISQSDLRACLTRLENNNSISHYKDYYYRDTYYKLCSGMLFEQLALLLKPENKEWYKHIVSVAHTGRYVNRASDMVNSAISLLMPSSVVLTKFPSSIEFIDELSFIIFYPDFHYVVAKLPDSVLLTCLEAKMGLLLDSDLPMLWDYMRKVVVEERKTRRKTAATPVLLSCFNFFYYLGTGKMCAELEALPVNLYSMLTAAVHSLYAKDYAQSLKLFAKALALHNKQVDRAALKGYFPWDSVNYLYLVCLLLNGTDTAGKISSLYKKDNFMSGIGPMLLFRPIYSFFIDHQQPKVNKAMLTSYVEHTVNDSLLPLVWLTYTRMGIWPDDVKQPCKDDSYPTWAWLRNELKDTPFVISRTAGKPDEADSFGGSLFTRLNIKPVWEMRLEEILSANQKAPDSTKPDQNERLIYLLDSVNINPILQKRLKSGAWSVGKRLSISALKHLSTDRELQLDAFDDRLAESVSVYDYDIYISHSIGCLVGCDRVFAGDNYDLRPVNIHEDKPCLIINRDKDGSFSVATNVEELRTGLTKPVYYRKNSDTDYSVYSPTAFEKKVYAQILAQEKYPKQAEPLLMKLIMVLGGKTEVHSNMAVELDGLEQVKGETKLTLRCMPSNYDRYDLSVSVHAFGELAFVPGKGNVSTIAEKDGRKVQVIRNLRKEKHNMTQLTQQLVSLGVIDDESDFAPSTITETVTADTAAFLEIIQWSKDNPEVCELEWPEGSRLKYHPAIGARSANISFKSKNGWFEVEGDVRVDEDEVISLQQLLELMHEQGHRNYIKIGEQEFISLSSDLKRVLKRLDTVTTDRRNHLQMASAAAGLIGDLLDDRDLKVTRSKELDALRQRIKDSAKTEPQVPDTLQANLRDYQVEGYEWMWRVTSWGAGACLADDMGLGKTLQTIALLLDQAADGPSLVVAPASVVPNWRNELKRFAPSLNVTVLNTADNREEAINEASAGDVVVTTYALLNIQHEQLAKKEWTVACLDEAHTIKNPNTKMSKAAMLLQAKRKVILTGTPIQNHLSELWNLFQFINPGLLGSAEQFGHKFIEPIEGNHDKERQSQLRRLISPFLLRRTKGDVIDELPEKNEITVPVELTDDEMKVYEVHRRMAEKSVKADKVVKVSTLAEITKLREMACSVSLVDKRWKHESSKVAAFIDLAENLNGSGNRALVFSQFTSFFKQVREAMDKAKLPYLYLDGSTPMAQREQLVKDFQKGRCPFFLISLKAGGLGLNLTGANYVIHLDPWWNPAIEQQATDRAYRIGQKQDVTVYHLISQHTIEEKIQRLHKSKRDLADSLLAGTDLGHALTQEELLELLQ